MGFIYRITNIINGKSYIGKTDYSIKQRLIQHLHDSTNIDKCNRPLYRAMRKHGNSNFIIDIIEECNKTDICAREIYYINLFDTYRFGYNATLGGEGKSKLTISDDDIISKYKQCLSAAKVARDLGCSHRTVISKLNSLGISTEKTIQRRQEVINKTLGIKFNSITDACNYLINNHITDKDVNSIRTSISRAAHKRRKLYFKYEWELV